jgi:hypothetical protein
MHDAVRAAAHAADLVPQDDREGRVPQFTFVRLKSTRRSFSVS